MIDIALKYNMLDENARSQLNDFIDFLLSKNKMKEINLSEYYNRIQTVSRWSEEDVAYLRELDNYYNWKVEEW